MSTSFLDGATGNPINLKRRIALHATRGLPPSDGEAATGTLTFTSTTSDTETVTIGTRVYEFDTDSTVTSGNVSVDISGGNSASQSVTALVAAINGDSDAVVYAHDGAGDTVVVNAITPGTAGNSLASTQTCANATWGGATLSGGTDGDWVDFRSNGGPIIIEPNEIERLIIATGGAPAASLPGKVEIGGGPIEIGDVDPSNRGMIRCLANVFGKYALTDNTTWYKWEFALNASTTPSSFLGILNDNDINPRTRFNDILLGGFNISAAPNENLAISFPFAVGEYDLHGIPVQTFGTGGPLPKFKRTWSGNWDDTNDKDLYVRFDTDNGSTWVVSVKVGSAASYSGTTTITEGKWSRLNDENSDRIGSLREQVMIYIPSGWGGSANDVYKVPQNRAAWTQSLNTERPISSVNTIFVLDGDEVRVEGGWDVEGRWEELNTFQDTAGRQGATTERSGEFNVTITPTRRIVDLTLQKAIHEASSVAVYIDCISDVKIGSTGKYFRFLMAAPSAKVYGPLFGTQAGGRNREESPRIVCNVPASAGTYDSMNFGSHFHIVLQNDVSSL